jgi:hypothetical protein
LAEYNKLSKQLNSLLNTEKGQKLLDEIVQHSNQYIDLAQKTIFLKKANNPKYIDN